MCKYRNKTPATLFRGSPAKWLAAAAAGGVCALGWVAPALAYRPFDGTDAAVADLGEVEIEFGTGPLRSGSQSTLLGPYAVFNYGFADRWEMVLQGEGQAFPVGAGPSPVPNGAFLK